LGDDDSVGSARTGDCDEGRSGAEKQALDVHFLTSSQKLISGSGYFLLKDSVPCPIPNCRKRRAPRCFFLVDITDAAPPFNHDVAPLAAVPPLSRRAVAQMTRF